MVYSTQRKTSYVSNSFAFYPHIIKFAHRGDSDISFLVALKKKAAAFQVAVMGDKEGKGGDMNE